MSEKTPEENLEVINEHIEEIKSVFETIDKKIDRTKRKRIIDYLDDLLGEGVFQELMRILDPSENYDIIDEMDNITPELKINLKKLKVLYGREIPSLLALSSFDYPYSWNLLQIHNIKYDLEQEEHVFKCEIIKNNFEKAFFEYPFNEHISLVDAFTESLIDSAKYVTKMGLTEEEIDGMKRLLNTYEILRTTYESIIDSEQ